MKKIAILLLILPMFFVGCKQKSKNKDDISFLMPNVSGKAGELVIVIEKGRWKGHIGDTLIKYLAEPVEGLPQPEPLFDLVDVPHKAFSNIFQTHRNIFKILISPKVEENKLFIKKNVWAKPQTFIQLNAKDNETFFEIFEKNKEQIVESYINAENQRIVDNYRKYEEVTIGQRLSNSFGLSMVFPSGYKVDMLEDDFAWISHETPRLSQGVVIYTEDYVDTAQFNKKIICGRRDLLFKDKIPGPSDGSYMQLEQKHYPIISKPVFLQDSIYAVEMRGLWRVENDFMGGPFVSYTFVNEQIGKLVNVYAYVYAGKNDKRNYMRQVEGILYSLKFSKPKAE